jgi:hypothetical protein
MDFKTHFIITLKLKSKNVFLSGQIYEWSSSNGRSSHTTLVLKLLEDTNQYFKFVVLETVEDPQKAVFLP